MGNDRAAVVEWLLEGDPAIRWQVMRDLEGASESVWRAEQERVGAEGWGAMLLSHQDPKGRWTPRIYGRKWISTTYTMVLLRAMGLPPRDPRALAACALFLERGVTEDGGIGVSADGRRSDVCVTAMVLALFYWFGFEDPTREAILDHLLARQHEDGGWNCVREYTHSSFHTTISALEALRQCAEAGAPRQGDIAGAEARGREFLLRHHLFRSHRTGEVVDPRFLRFSFPPRWHYDVLRGLDYFWSARHLEDPRLDEAIDVVVSKRRRDGRWPLQQRWAGETWFEMEEVGKPSRWNTLRAMRVLEAWPGSL
jgi:hypothetical protein